MQRLGGNLRKTGWFLVRAVRRLIRWVNLPLVDPTFEQAPQGQHDHSLFTEGLL